MPDAPADDPTDDDNGITHDGDIKNFVMDPPAGAHAWPHIKAAEPLTLTTAAGDFHDPKEGKAILQRYGFKDGYARRWVNADGSFVVLRVYRFKDAGSGEKFANFNIDADEAGSWGPAKDFTDAPDGVGFVKPKKDKDGRQESMAVGAFSDIAVVVIADQMPPAKVSVPEAVFLLEYTKI